MANLQQLFGILDRIEAAKGRNEKTRLFETLIAQDEQWVREVASMMWDPFVNYFVTVAPKKVATAMTDPTRQLCYKINEETIWSEFVQVMGRLSKRELTGSAAVDTIHRLIADTPVWAQKWLIRIANKDWKVGLGRSTFDKFFPSDLPKFDVQLCEDWDGKGVPFRHTLASTKFDGIRGVIGRVNPHIPGEFVVQSRSGLPLYNVEFFRRICEEACASLGDFVFDGEFYAGNWNLSQSITQTEGEHPRASELRYHVFAVMTTEEWMTRKTPTMSAICETTRAVVQYINEALGCNRVVRVEEREVNDMEAIQSSFDVAINSGFEGLVFKDGDATYNFDRDGTWLRKKLVVTEDLFIMEAVPGWLDLHSGAVYESESSVPVSNGTKHPCAPIIREVHCGRQGDEKPRSMVGSGFTDELQKRWYQEWASDPANLIGRCIEMKHYGETKDGRLRHPVFLRERLDKRMS